MHYLVMVALLGFVAVGCCGPKKQWPMKDNTMMAEPVAAEEVAPVVEAVEPVAEQVAPMVEQAAPMAEEVNSVVEEVPAVEEVPVSAGEVK